MSLSQAIGRCLCAVVAPLLFCGILQAQVQSTGSILGAVQDPSGAAIQGAQVTIKNDSTGSVRSAQSDAIGNYLVPNLAPGTYTVSVATDGFKTSIIPEVVLQVDQRARIDVVMALGETVETVSVEAYASTIETETGSVGEVIDQSKILELPLNGRNFLQLATLTPGAVNPNNSLLTTAGGSISVNGGGDLSNNYQMDGIVNQEGGVGRMNFIPSPDLIGEFKIVSNSYSAEYGRSGGAQINLITKRGTNDYHGTAYYFRRDDSLDGRNFFQPGPNPEFRRAQYGATFGGRLPFSEKDFFFFSYDGKAEAKGLTVTSTLPSLPIRTGDFSATGATIHDPLTLNAETGSRQAFANNMVPAERISPQATYFSQFWPAPQTSARTGNFVANPSRTDDSNQYSIRYDRDFTANDTVNVRLTHSKPKFFEPLGLVPIAAPFEGFGENYSFSGHNHKVGWTHIFSPTTLNDVSFGYSRFVQVRSNLTEGRNFIEEAGIQGVPPAGQLNGFPWLAISGWQGLADNAFSPVDSPSTNYQFQDTFSKIVGRHALKMGVDIISNPTGLDMRAITRGQIVFSPRYSTAGPGAGGGDFHSFADFLLGYPSSTQLRDAPLLQNLRQSWYQAYFQDDWAVTKTLTLNLGLRYEIWQRPTEKDDRMVVVDLESKQFVRVGTPEAEAIGMPRSVDHSDKNDFGPRIGFAWRFLNNNKTVLRGGYGLFYQWIVGDMNFNYGLGPPFLNTISLTGPPDMPLMTFERPFDGSVQPSANGNVYTRGNRRPYNQVYSLSLGHSFSRAVAGEVSYVGNAGRKNQMSYAYNQARPGPGSVVDRRPYPTFGNLNGFVDWGTSHYDSLQAKLKKDAGSDGLMMLVAYTWAKALAAGRAGGDFYMGMPIRDFRNWKDDAGPSAFDVRHRLSLSTVYEIPFGRGKALATDLNPVANFLLGGWKVGGIITLQSGFNLTPGSAIDTSNSGNNRPDVTGDPNGVDHANRQSMLDGWFRTSVFQQATQYTFGNSGTGIIRGPGLQTFDLSAYKDFEFGEGRRIQFRAEFFNAFNHTNLGNPNTTFGSASFGRIFSAKEPRDIQLGLRLDF